MSVASLLDTVWAAFRQAGITDDLRIIEGIAALLLEQENVSLNNALPARPTGADFNESAVKDALREASKEANGAATLFDRFVLFRLSGMRPGGQYPTPRHIVRLMTALADASGHTIADFACGSAGLLAASNGSQLIGVDISPEWARLARANLLLNRKQGDIHEGNAVRLFQNKEAKFERVVMNPPFGEKIKGAVEGRSETAFITLALDHVGENGRVAVLAPGGVLFSESRAEAALRKRLVDEVALEAVITLPNDAFQPYSTLATHLLLVENKRPQQGVTFIWFMRLVYDGYAGGRTRDLTTDPKTPNDLTLAEKAVAALRQPLDNPSQSDVVVQALTDGNELLGFLIRPHKDVTLLSVRYLPQKEKKDSALFVVRIQRDQNIRNYQFEPVFPPELKNVENDEELIRKRLGLTRQTPIPPPDIFRTQSIQWGQAPTQAVGGVLIKTYDGARPQLTGVAIPRTALQARGYTLQPDDYLRPPEIRVEQRRPHDILLEIHQRQQELSRRMERLAGWLAPERSSGYATPELVKGNAPLGTLSVAQEEIWKEIASYFSDQHARPFTLSDIQVECDENEKRLALEMFEAMGLIVPVTLKHPESGALLNFYRLTENNDVWPVKEENEPPVKQGDEP